MDKGILKISHLLNSQVPFMSFQALQNKHNLSKCVKTYLNTIIWSDAHTVSENPRAD